MHFDFERCFFDKLRIFLTVFTINIDVMKVTGEISAILGLDDGEFVH